MDSTNWVRCKDCALARWHRGPGGGISRSHAGRCRAPIPVVKVTALCFANNEHTTDYELAKISIWPDYKGPCDFFLPLSQEGEASSSADDDQESLSTDRN